MKHVFLILILSIYMLTSCRSSARFSTTSSTRNEKSANEYEFRNEESSHLNNFIKKWLDTPYKYGGMSKSGVDCSGFSSIVMREVYGLKIPRSADDQYNAGEKVGDGWRSPGDLVFFKNVRGHGVDHVGIYMGDNRFAHASTKKGVIVSDLDEDYYRKRYVGTCRYSK